MKEDQYTFSKVDKTIRIGHWNVFEAVISALTELVNKPSCFYGDPY